MFPNANLYRSFVFIVRTIQVVSILSCLCESLKSDGVASGCVKRLSIQRDDVSKPRGLSQEFILDTWRQMKFYPPMSISIDCEAVKNMCWISVKEKAHVKLIDRLFINLILRKIAHPFAIRSTCRKVSRFKLQRSLWEDNVGMRLLGTCHRDMYVSKRGNDSHRQVQLVFWCEGWIGDD